MRILHHTTLISAQHLLCKIHAKKLSTIFGYQCSKHASLSSTNAYLESSLRNGASFLVTESRTVTSVNDHLIELQSLDDYPLTGITLCYRGESLQEKVDTLHNFHQKTGRMYDYITYPLEELARVGSLHDSIANARAASMKAVGVDVRYSALTSIDSMLGQIDAAANALGGNIGVLLVEANVSTAASCRELVDWAHAKSIPVVAIDTLRANARSGSPGMLIDPTVRRTGLPPSSANLHEAMEELKRSINACIHAEMQFMERKLHLSALVSPEAVCLGHTLQAVQSSIRYDEEWEYVLRTKLDPDFEGAVAKLKKCSEQHKNFVTLYSPLRKKLNETYRHVLLVQTRMLCEKAMTSASSIESPLWMKGSKCLLHECIMKSLSAMSFDVVCGSNFEVPAYEWETDLANISCCSSNEWPINILDTINSNI